MDNKFCRICWNTNNWHAPTGEAPKLETSGSYVHQNGFGHEEWLFNFSWEQPGPKGVGGHFRYGFLQPIGKYRPTYIGNAFDAYIYTIADHGIRVAVGIIRNVFVPDDAEIASAFSYMRRMGWIAAMKSDVRRIGGKATRLEDGPASIINVRFRQADVEFFEPRFVVKKPHKIWNSARYHPFEWDGKSLFRSESSIPVGDSAKLKTEAQINRAAIAGTTYDPAHNRLQNSLFDYLRKQYGRAAVSYERDAVDLVLRKNGTEIYIEIKTALTAKQCIRQAFGQLLEYSFYPRRREAQELVVVGEPPASSEDFEYLGRLRKKFSLPVRYVRWDSINKRLDGSL